MQRIEIDPDAKTGTVYINADLCEILASTRVTGGDLPRNDGRMRKVARELTFTKPRSRG